MGLGNMWVCRGPCTVQRFLVKAGTAASINAGEPVVQNTAGDAEYVKSPGADVTTSDTFVGIAVSTSTDTAAADGYVEVAIPTFGTVYRGQAKTKASLADSQRLTKVVIDYTSSKYTVDESTTTNGCFQIVDFNSYTGEVDFLVDMTEALNS
jgi:hypothetical protein